MKKITLTSSILLFVSVSGILWANSLQAPVQKTNKDWINDQAIVKFDSDLTEIQVDNEIIEIDKMFPLVSFKKLYKDQRTFEEIAKKFPERSKRIPKITKTFSRRHTYVLTFLRKEYDILDLCKELEQRKSVEYAEPNQIMRTNKILVDE